tara:strand:+ start:166 stop:342 length:177 start_codon:yes stop_codon:yes gene_type:complete
MKMFIVIERVRRDETSPPAPIIATVFADGKRPNMDEERMDIMYTGMVDEVDIIPTGLE